MGKYMKKSSKLKAHLTLMEMPQSSSSSSSLGGGVTTRAALRRLQNSRLRTSRRLANHNPNSISPLGPLNSAADSVNCSAKFKDEATAVPPSSHLSFPPLDRSTRETTPCSLIGGPDTVGTPGSTTSAVSSSATNQRMQTTTRSTIPVALEMDEFFAGAEQHQQRSFTDKYNFDPVNETPLPGRYQWERVKP